MLRFLPLLLLTFLCTCAPASEEDTTGELTQTADQQPAPVYYDLTAVEFAEKMGEENTVILDVRNPGETADGVIPGSILMSYRTPDFADEIKKLDPDKTYLVYCASGGRSSKTCTMLNEAGFENVYNLKGGYAAWK